MIENELPHAQLLTPTKKRTVWQNANFIILLISGIVMGFGSKIYELTLPLILYDYTNSAVVMSTMKGIEFLPNLLLAMFIGVLVDRVRKKQWSLWMVLLQILILLVLFFSIQYHHQTAVLFYLCGFLLMTFNYAFGNARMSMIKQALPVELLTSANASFNFISTFITIIGPALTGLILMLSSLHLGLLITAISFSLAFFILLLLNLDETTSRNSKTGFWKELKEGWIELLHNKTLWFITIAVIFLNSTGGMVDTTIIFYSKDVLHLTNAGLGLLLSSSGVGGLIGSFIIGRIRNRWSTGVIISITTLLIGLTYLLMYLSSTNLLLGVALLFNGLLNTISNVCIWTFRQESTPQQLIGRITGITGSIFKLAMPFAIYFAGWISELAEPSLVFLLTFIGNTIIFLLCRFSLLWKY